MKQLWILFVFILAGLTLSGCTKEAEAVPTMPSAELPTAISKRDTITIYSIDPDTMTLVPVQVPVDEAGITPERIRTLVVDNLNEHDIVSPSLEKKGKKMIISFSSRGEPVQDCDKEMEHLILECFSNSFLDNLEEYNDIIFRVEGKPYKSPNLRFKKNEVYTSR